MRRAAIGLALLLSTALPAGGSELLWIATFGDSITEGCCEFPRDGGYPQRLATAALMNCTYLTAPWPPGDPNAQECLAAQPFPACAVVRSGDCVIANRGQAFEWATGALTRLQTEVLPEWNWDVLVLMEGSNDIWNSVSAVSIRQAYEMMDQVATEQGVDTVHASVIEFPPTATKNPTLLNQQVYGLVTELTNLTTTRSRYFSDQSERLCPDSGLDFHDHTRTQCQYYNSGHLIPGDYQESGFGHPGHNGYDNMADGFLGTLTQKAVPGSTTPSAPSGPVCGSPAAYTWTKEAGESANWYRVEIDGGSAYNAWHQETDWRPAQPDLCQPDASPNNTCSLTAGLPALGVGTHTWRVRGRNPAGLGPWSATASFEILSANLQLQNTTVTGVVTRRACVSITAGNLGAGDYVVDGPSANLVFNAGSTIALGNGFSVRQGSFTAGVDY